MLLGKKKLVEMVKNQLHRFRWCDKFCQKKEEVKTRIDGNKLFRKMDKKKSQKIKKEICKKIKKLTVKRENSILRCLTK